MSSELGSSFLASVSKVRSRKILRSRLERRLQLVWNKSYNTSRTETNLRATKKKKIRVSVNFLSFRRRSWSKSERESAWFVCVWAREREVGGGGDRVNVFGREIYWESAGRWNLKWVCECVWWERERERDWLTEKDCACVFTQTKFSLRPFQRSGVDTTSRYQLPPVNDELNNVNCWEWVEAIQREIFFSHYLNLLSLTPIIRSWTENELARTWVTFQKVEKERKNDRGRAWLRKLESNRR